MIFVTGATGFLGKTLVTYLRQQGYAVRILARPSSDVSFFQAMPEVEITLGDVLDAESVQQGMRGCSIVVHAAARFRFWGAEAVFEATNVSGTANVLQAAVATGVERFIYISTIAVAGNLRPHTLIDETIQPNPVDPYQKTKLQAEQLVQQFQAEYGLNSIILRLGALYGPYGRYAFNRLFFEEFLRGWRIQVAGGRHITFPCYVQDAAAGIEAAIQLGKAGEIYNIAGACVSHQELNQLVGQLARKPSWRLNLPKWMMIGTAALMEYWATFTGKEPFYPLNLQWYVFQDWVVDSQKAQRCLNFKATPLETGIRETLAWYQSLGLD